MVVEDFRARTARPRVGHLPEIVARVLGALVVADAHDALGRDADFLRPDVVGLVVVDVDGRPQLVRRQLVDLRQQLPRIVDRIALEVVAEAEVAQHLEERVMARRVADVLQVVVLAAGAHAALRRRRALVAALVDAQEHVLELDHAGIDEQQRRIVARHERRTRHERVALGDEVIEELAADVGDLHGGMAHGAPPAGAAKRDAESKGWIVTRPGAARGRGGARQPAASGVQAALRANNEHDVSGAPVRSHALTTHPPPSRSIVMKPNVAVASRLATTAPDRRPPR